MQLAQKGWSGGGVPTASPMPKSVSSSRKGKRSTVDGFVIAYLSSVELLYIYHGVITMTFFVRRRYDLFPIG